MKDPAFRASFKGGKDREVPLSPKLREQLPTYDRSLRRRNGWRPALLPVTRDGVAGAVPELLGERHSELRFISNARSSSAIRTPCSSQIGAAFSKPSIRARPLVHFYQRLREELRIAERIASEPRPIHAPGLVDQDRGVQFNLLVVVVAVPAPRVGAIGIG